MAEKEHNKIVERPPVIVVVGHIDHGKSTLLDYIRKTNIVGSEAGGITQHTSAYEVIHKNDAGAEKKITFLDTPGHEAFSGMRVRGVSAADIAVLVVSAEDSVKAQTLEAIKAITAGGIPFIVAINKIDKPAANIEKVKMDLAEHSVYVEGFGGNVPCISISAKTGAGIPELLDMILLVAELEELTGDKAARAEGVVVESHVDMKRGISATLLVKNGTLKNGEYIVVGNAIAPARLMENFLGKSVSEAAVSSPVVITGFNKLPSVGEIFTSSASKKEAEMRASAHQEKLRAEEKLPEDTAEEGIIVVPVILKADVAGTLEAIEKELSKISKEGIRWKIVTKGSGNITETDVKLASGMAEALLIGFNVKADKSATDLAERLGVPINMFDVIYKITEWFDGELEKRKPRVTTEETAGTAKIIKCFSRTKDKQIVGGKVTEGTILSGANVKIMRRDFEIGRGEIMELQQHKAKAREAAEGSEFGVLIESKTEIAPGDVIQAYVSVTK